MSKSDPHTQLRHALIDEHVAKGWMDEVMYLAYCVILRQADFETGVWRGSAERLAAACLWSKSKANRALNRLVAGHYISSKHVPDVRGNYDVLINNFVPTVGSMKGKKLRRTKTVDYRSDSSMNLTSDSPVIPYSVTGESVPIQTSDSPVTRVQDVVVKTPPPSLRSSPSKEGVKNNNNQTVVVVVPPSEDEKSDGGLVAGYSPEQIAAHAEACKTNAWVKANDSLAARRREGFVRHLMEQIEPAKRVTRVPVDAPAYRQDSGNQGYLEKSDL